MHNSNFSSRMNSRIESTIRIIQTRDMMTEMKLPRKTGRELLRLLLLTKMES